MGVAAYTRNKGSDLTCASRATNGARGLQHDDVRARPRARAHREHDQPSQRRIQGQLPEAPRPGHRVRHLPLPRLRPHSRSFCGTAIHHTPAARPRQCFHGHLRTTWRASSRGPASSSREAIFNSDQPEIRTRYRNGPWSTIPISHPGTRTFKRLEDATSRSRRRQRRRRRGPSPRRRGSIGSPRCHETTTTTASSGSSSGGTGITTRLARCTGAGPRIQLGRRHASATPRRPRRTPFPWNDYDDDELVRRFERAHGYFSRYPAHPAEGRIRPPKAPPIKTTRGGRLLSASLVQGGAARSLPAREGRRPAMSTAALAAPGDSRGISLYGGTFSLKHNTANWQVTKWSTTIHTNMTPRIPMLASPATHEKLSNSFDAGCGFFCARAQRS